MIAEPRAHEVDTIGRLCEGPAPWWPWPECWEWRLVAAVHELALDEDRRRARWTPRTAQDFADADWRALVRNPRVEAACEAAYTAHRLASPAPRQRAKAKPSGRLAWYAAAVTGANG